MKNEKKTSEVQSWVATFKPTLKTLKYIYIYMFIVFRRIRIRIFILVGSGSREKWPRSVTLNKTIAPLLNVHLLQQELHHIILLLDINSLSYQPTCIGRSCSSCTCIAWLFCTWKRFFSLGIWFEASYQLIQQLL